MSPVAVDPAAPAGEQVLVGVEEVTERLTAAYRGAFTAATAARKRDPHALGLSSLGRCTRAGAYALAGTPVSDPPTPDEGRAANLGTWEHEGLLPYLVQQLPGARTEVPVTLRAVGMTLPGHIDLEWWRIVMDLKTVGEHRLGGVRYHGRAYADHRLQVWGYAVAAFQAGREIEYVAWLYMDRANGDYELIVEPFTNAGVLRVIDRVALLLDFADNGPDEGRRDEMGPGLSVVCDSCPWLRRCWGDDARPGKVGAQRILARTNPEIEQALLDYVDARERESTAKADKKFAAAKLDGRPHGVYGSVSYGRDRDSTPVDAAACVQVLESLGHPLPRTTKRGNLRIKLIAPREDST